MAEAISVKNMHVSYLEKEVITDVSLTIKTGKLIGIIGPNGAGKSTFVKALLNLVPIDQGEIHIFGDSIKHARKKIAYVPQRNQIDMDFPINVFETVLTGTYPSLGLLKRPMKSDKEWALQCLKELGMEDFSNRQIGELSGGQQQRVFLARALAQKADLFILDEPFVGIDMGSEETIIQLLQQLKDMGKTILVVHHDLSKAAEYFDELVLFNKHLIHFGTTEEVLTPEVMMKAYESQFSFMKNMGGI